jgi:hypothetical protein
MFTSWTFSTFSMSTDISAHGKLKNSISIVTLSLIYKYFSMSWLCLVSNIRSVMMIGDIKLDIALPVKIIRVVIAMIDMQAPLIVP